MCFIYCPQNAFFRHFVPETDFLLLWGFAQCKRTLRFALEKKLDTKRKVSDNIIAFLANTVGWYLTKFLYGQEYKRLLDSLPHCGFTY